MIRQLLQWHASRKLHTSASILGSHGNAVRIAKERERVKAKARWLREQLGLPDDPRLA